MSTSTSMSARKTSFSAERGVMATFIVVRSKVVAIFRAVRVHGGEWVEKHPDDWTYTLPGYEHGKGHCACHKDLLECRRASVDEYAPLLVELSAAGYRVYPLQSGAVIPASACYSVVCESDGETSTLAVFTRRDTALDFAAGEACRVADELGAGIPDTGAEDESYLSPSAVRSQLESGMSVGIGECGRPYPLASIRIDESELV